MYRVQVLGCSYGSLFAARLLLAGSHVSLVCTARERDLIAAEGFRLRLPVARLEEPIDVRSSELPGSLTAVTPQDADPAAFDLVVLAIQEPQYRAPELRALLGRIAAAGVPCLSIMNMPPLPFLARFPQIDLDDCRSCYADPSVWEGLEPRLMTHCSADPQAVRRPGGPANEIEVRLATNFRAAPFEDRSRDALLHALSRAIEAGRLRRGGREVELPVKLKVDESRHMALSKWPMLVTGNYRCFVDGGIRSIQQAVHDDPDASRAIYQSVCELLRALGSPHRVLVPFERYAAAARSLTEPSSAAKAVANGATHIERVDRLVLRIAAQQGIRLEPLEQIVSDVDARLAENRHKAVHPG